MIQISCPVRGTHPAWAEGASWRCDYCQRSGRINRIPRYRDLHLAQPGEEQCKIVGCGHRSARVDLCWKHYDELRREVPARHYQGKGSSWEHRHFLALLKREEKQKRREKLEHILYLMFEKASPSGRLTSLSRRERGFINEECHGAYERKKLDDRDFQKNYAWYRIAWYGRMKGLWRQSVKRKTDQRVKAMKVTNAVQRKLIA